MTAAAAVSTTPEPIIAPDTRPVTFYSKSRNLRLIRRPEITRPLQTGGLEITGQASRVEFAPDGQITVEPGAQVMTDSMGWLADAAELERRGLPTDHQVPRDLLTALRSHRGFNQDFYELGAEPDRPQPTDERFIEMMTEAVGNLDMAKLEELRDKEKETHARPMLLSAVATAIGQVTKVQEGLAQAAKNAGDQGGGQASGTV